MGWNESPPYFCAATETVADLANASIRAGTTFPPHRLESAAETGRGQDLWSTRPTHLSPQPRDFAQEPLRYVDVCLDDLIGVAQGSPDDLAQLRRVILHNLDRVFRPLEPSDDPNRREPTSLKKLLQGDGLLTTRKTVLGWTLDCARCTLELTDRRRDRSPGGTSFGIPAYEGANVRQEVGRSPRRTTVHVPSSARESGASRPVTSRSSQGSDPRSPHKGCSRFPGRLPLVNSPSRQSPHSAIRARTGRTGCHRQHRRVPAGPRWGLLRPYRRLY